MRLYLTLTLCLLALAACSETTDVPLSPQSSGLELANGVQRTLLTDLSYSGTEVGGGPTFSFDLPAGLAGVFHEVVTPAAGEEPCWFKFVAGTEPHWVQGAGLIRELPVQGRLLGLGTIEVPVTGTKTEGGQTTVVEGTLVIKLAEHVVEP
ncbi:MAG: hypothetical protein KY397_01910, partial [Gemmatimonadetes bacterium]|nr:hypothetical protein [Gemmatimonadota bacterium]